MILAVSRRPLRTKALVRVRVSTCGFVVHKVTLGQVSILVLRFSPVNITPPSLLVLISPGRQTLVQRHSLTPRHGQQFLILFSVFKGFV
jgi:hypothetical protein